MREVLMTALFKSDLDSLDKVMQVRVLDTIKQIDLNYRHPSLNSKKQRSLAVRNIWRSRVNDNFRVLWEWVENGNLRLWRVGTHKMVDAINYIRSEPKHEWRIFTRDEADHGAIELESLVVSRDLPQPFKHVPINILRLFGVPDEQLEAVKSLADEEEIWDLPIQENVKSTLLDILTNPDWTLDNLLDARQLLYRTTVDHLEGYCEGKLKQLLLNLNEDQESFVKIKANGPVLFKGVAGSGKTTIGLYRAHHLLMDEDRQLKWLENEERSKGVLVLTYTGTLAKTLNTLYEELFGNDWPHGPSISTFDSWMLNQLRQCGFSYSPAETSENRGELRRQLVERAQREVAEQYPSDRVLLHRSAQYLLEEIDEVIRARSLATLYDYQAIERVGRGVGLDRRRHRPIMWAIYKRYQELLDEEGLFDWKDLPRLVFQRCQPLPMYDAIIIDEAQDLPPSHLYLASRLIEDYNRDRTLTLLADPAQSIYYRGIPWKEAGINIQGRTRILAKNYRNTRQILEAARPIAEGCTDLMEANEFIPPTSTDRRGPKPVVAMYRSSQASNRFLIDKIITLCRSGSYRPGDIAILARSNGLYRFIAKEFQSASLPIKRFRDLDFDIFENQVKYVTMHSAKGLEFPVVFLIGLDDNHMPKLNPKSETRDEDELQERKLFYVSMTRAAERLYLLHPQVNRCRYIRDIDTDAVRSVSC